MPITTPLRFVPYLRPCVWGGRSLALQLNKILPADGPYGESWEISDHPLYHSVVASGPLAGLTLRHLIEEHPQDILGNGAKAQSPFPWLIKYLDACDWLSVQVHPDDALAQQIRPGEQGKTEAWFVLAAQPTSRIYAGLKPEVGPEDFRRALAQKKLAELLHSFTPTPGDCVFLPAGTVHAMGGGILLAEIQQNSDVTLRLYDWDRVDAQGQGRALHIDEGLKAIDWNRGPVQPVNVADLADAEQTLVQCPYFDLTYLQYDRPFEAAGANRLGALIVLRGQAQVGDDTIRQGEVWLLPACLPRLTVIPEAGFTAISCTASRTP